MSPEKEKTDAEKLPPCQTPIKRLVKWGEEHPTIGPTVPKISRETWILTVDGEVDKALRLSWKDFLTLPMVESASDFHCVEGWSVLGCRWEGVKFKSIMELVKPKQTAKFVSFECADGYTTSLSIEELLGDDIILACKLDGEYLEPGFGAPVRLVVPSKYAYKSAMWITRIKFTAEKEMGFWEKRGFSDTADVWTNDRYSR